MTPASALKLTDATLMSSVRHRAIYLARRRSVAAARDEGVARLDDQPACDDAAADFAPTPRRSRWQCSSRGRRHSGE